MTPFALREFADRVCAGTGQDRTLEYDICSALLYKTAVRTPSSGQFAFSDETYNTYKPGGITTIDPPITDSVDAVEKMRLRLVPQTQTMMQQYNDCFVAEIWEPADFSYSEIQASAPTEPRARLAALLRLLARRLGGTR